MRDVTAATVINVINNTMKNLAMSNFNLDIEQLDEDLLGFGIDSFEFIMIIVSLEEEFKCEIPDSKLLITEMNTVRKILDVLQMVCNEKQI